MPTVADPTTKSETRAYVLGGNASTLAFTSSLVAENRQVTAWLVPLAWTPVGVVLGENWQRVGIAADNLAGWTDQTFDPSDERSFVSSLRELDLLARIGWNAAVPEALSEDVVVNPDDLPEDILDALAHAPESLVQCAICRRTCVRDHFVWNERRLCAWDYHQTVFGKRGPWRDGPYEERFWETLPQAAYVAGPLLEEIGVDAVLAIDGLEDELAHRIINEAIAGDPAHAHIAVSTAGGYTLLRERERKKRLVGPAQRNRQVAMSDARSRRARRRVLTDRAIARLGAIFAVLFVVLAVRQLWLQVVAGPRLAANQYNPRHAQVAVGRGSILASDGTPLAVSRGAKRIYPQGALVAQAVGYASSRYGTAGLEDAFDRVLTAHTDAVDPFTQFREILAGTHGAPRGADVVTTLDLAVQKTLVAGLAQHARAAGVVIDPRTGAVLALASIPSYDPNRLDALWNALSHDPASPLLDRSVGGLYPPGSTFKIYTAAVALDAGVVTPQSTFSDYGGFTVGNFTVHNDEEETTGTQDLAGAFALSSNVDFAQIALKIGVSTWFDYAQKWGLGEPIPFDVPVTRDRLPAKQDVYDGILAQLGFGQASLLVTPMRMGLIGATVAHDGTTPRPYLVRRIAGSETGLATRPETIAQPISADTAHEVRDLMVQVVKRGTGTAAQLAGVTVAGKTGTATNPHGRSHAWFVAFAPAEAPRVAVAIVVENVGYGGTYAAPIARDVLRVALARSRS